MAHGFRFYLYTQLCYNTSMQRQDFSVKSAADGLVLNIVVMVPDVQVRGIVQFSHGMAEHKERYFEFMEHLVAQGFVAAIHDHRGHGESVLNPEDLGYFYDKDGSAIVEDLHQITLKLKELFPSVPVVLFGHSMGSLVVRSYVKKYDDEIDKLVVCGAPGNNPLTGAALAIVSLLNVFYGERHRSELIQNLAFGSYNKQVGEVELENGWLCAKKDVVHSYNSDELCGFTFTLNGFKNLFSLLKTVYSKKGWNLGNPDLPILFIAGEKDPVILGEKGWYNAQEFMRSCGYKDVKGCLYDDMRHEILNEEKRELVYSDVVNWIDGKLDV